MDISERVKAEEALRESEERFRTLVASMDDVVFTLDCEQRHVGVFGRWFERQGVSPEMFLGKTAREILGAEQASVHEAANERALAGENAVYEWSVETSAGIQHYQTSVSPLRDSEGAVVGIVGVGRDITERKQAEDALRESEERYSSLFENNHSVMLLIDPETADIVDANPAACSFYGYSKAEITNKKITEINILTSEQVFQEMEQAKLEQRKHFYFRHRLASGEVRDVEVYSGPIKVGGKGLLYSIIHDITKRVRAEEKIKASLKEKEMLLREIYHRVKNNMQVVSSLLRIQSRQLKDKQAIEMFQDNRDRITSMALVHEQLYQSKDLANVNFGAYIRKLVNSLSSSRETDAGKVILEIEIEDVTLGVNTAIPCGLIINELVSNAFKHAFPGGREGIISIAFRTTNEKRVELIIRDNGVGLPKDMDFRHADTLGLQLVTNLVEHQLLGQIELRRNEGTEFRIKFVDAKGREKI
jgi:PAS domain S-box-containing protein